jgi:hypothetical protein
MVIERTSPTMMMVMIVQRRIIHYRGSYRSGYRRSYSGGYRSYSSS